MVDLNQNLTSDLGLEDNVPGKESKVLLASMNQSHTDIISKLLSCMELPLVLHGLS